MKTIALVAALLFSLALTGFSADAAKAKKGKLHHVVALKFKEGTSKDQIKAVEMAFRDLKKKIKEVNSLKWGTNVSPEKHDKGFTHCFILTFKTDKDRDAYLIHPEHKEFGKLLGPVMADVFVVDFWSEK
jgi:hypothetical protein